VRCHILDGIGQVLVCRDRTSDIAGKRGIGSPHSLLFWRSRLRYGLAWLFSTGIAEILLIADETKFSQKDSAEWKKRSDLLRQALARLTVITRYHSVYGESFEMEQRGYEPPRFRRRNWFGWYVEWQP
jgi:hypothetical protein